MEVAISISLKFIAICIQFIYFNVFLHRCILKRLEKIHYRHPDQSHKVVIPLDLDFHHRPSVLGILVSNMLHNAPQLNHLFNGIIILV